MVFASMENKRLRLAALATLWNESSQSERHAILSKFLEIIGGSVPVVSGTDFTVADMRSLPMDNYSDIAVPAAWPKWFAGLSAHEKVDVFHE